MSVDVQKPLLTRVSPLAITWIACLFGTLVCVPWAGTLADELPHARASAIGWMVYLALVPLTLGFLTVGYALAHTTAGRMGSTPPPALAVAGGAVCLVGVYVARLPSSARRSSIVSASEASLSKR